MRKAVLIAWCFASLCFCQQPDPANDNPPEPSDKRILCILKLKPSYYRGEMRNALALAIAIVLGYFGTALGFGGTHSVPKWLRKFIIR